MVVDELRDVTHYNHPPASEPLYNTRLDVISLGNVPTSEEEFLFVKRQNASVTSASMKRIHQNTDGQFLLSVETATQQRGSHK